MKPPPNRRRMEQIKMTELEGTAGGDAGAEGGGQEGEREETHRREIQGEIRTSYFRRGALEVLVERAV